VGALVVALFALFFLRGPIAEIGEGEFGPSDCSQLFAVTRVEGEARTLNPALVRTWTTHQAWLRMSADRIAYGALPTWNGFNGGGVPHLANPQSAVFSPFSWSFYVFDPAWAVLIASFAKLFVLGFATFLFLRELGLTFAAGVVGAIVFMFSGAEITTLFAPQSSTVILLPLGLFFAERMKSLVERAIDVRRSGTVERTPLLRNSVFFTLAIVASFMGGAIDTFLFSALVVAAWLTVRLVQVAWRERGNVAARRELWNAALHVAGIAILSGLVAGIQVLPYLEYLRNARQAPLAIGDFALPAWPLFFFPLLFGQPTSTSPLVAGWPAGSFETLAACATGALPIVLTVFGISAARRDRMAAFFAVIGVAGLLVGGGALGNGLFQGLFPRQTETVVGRALVLFPFAIAAFSALAVDRVESRGRMTSARGAAALFVSGALLVLFARAIAERLFGATIADPSVTSDTLRIVASSGHLDFVVATCLLGLAAFAIANALQPGRARTLLLLALAPIVYAQVAAPLESYNPVTPNALVMPRTKALDMRAGLVGAHNPLVLGDVELPASINATYWSRSLVVNDPFHVRRYDQLFEKSFEPRGEFGIVSRTTRHALDLFAIQFVLDPDGWIDVDTEFGGNPPRRATWRETAEISADSAVSQYFTPPADGLTCVRFPWITKGLPNAREFSVTIDDLDTGERLAGLTLTPWSVRPAGRNVVDCIVPFPREAKVKGHALRLRIASVDDSRSRTSYAIGCRTDLPDLGPNWRATQGEIVLEGRVDLDLSYSHYDFALAGRIGPFDVFAVKNSVERYRTLGSARVVDTDGAAWTAVLDPLFDPRAEVVIEGAPHSLETRSTLSDEEGATVDVLDELDGRARLIVRRKTSGFVVTPIAWYPGWKARVNNESATLLCANYAFTGVAVPAGESLVEFEYAPKSVRNGLISSLFGLIVLFVAFAITLPPERRS